MKRETWFKKAQEQIRSVNAQMDGLLVICPYSNEMKSIWHLWDLMKSEPELAKRYEAILNATWINKGGIGIAMVEAGLEEHCLAINQAVEAKLQRAERQRKEG